MLLNEMFNMKGKVVLITGGCGHLGTAMSEALAEYGAIVYIGDIDFRKAENQSKKLTKIFKNQNFSINLDVSESNNIKKNINTILDENGKIDVLINNAYYGSGQELISMTDEDWHKGIDGTINSVYRCTKICLPSMIEKKSGKIINIASMYGIVSPDVSIYENSKFYNPANYGSGKAAIIQFTKYIAAVYGNKGINCNSISPGPFPSDIVQKNKNFIDHLNKKNPKNRIGKPEDLKGVTLLLASNASNYINGANIVVDGGWTIW